MAYDHDIGRDLRRLTPLGLSSALVTLLVTAELVSERVYGSDDVGTLAVAFWFLIVTIQVAAAPWLILLLTIMDDHGLPVPLRLPMLATVSAVAGAALFWWASPWKGGVCELVALVGWLYSIRDKLA